MPLIPALGGGGRAKAGRTLSLRSSRSTELVPGTSRATQRNLVRRSRVFLSYSYKYFAHTYVNVPRTWYL